MNVFEAVVLFAVIWFLTVFLVLPFGLRSQAEEGKVEPGTHAGAPANYRVRRMVLRVTILAAVIWLILFLIIVYSGIGIRDIDVFHRIDNPG